jgi:ArsR family transcriptional regulator, arsenate/arsenite/antimonite-responsive transcriptional repressor
MRVVSIVPHELFQALSDLTRLRIVRLLADTNEEACLCEIADSLQEPEYKLSRHLKILRQAGILSAVKEGRWVYHQIVRGESFLNLLFESVRSLPDPEKVFATDQKKFKKRIPLREGGRCRTEQNTAIKKSKVK